MRLTFLDLAESERKNVGFNFEDVLELFLVKLQCTVSILPIGIEETTQGAVIIAHMTEPSRFD